MSIPRHSIRFGKSGEKKILERHQDTFESVVLNASALAYFGKSLSTFIFIKSKGKSFFIDPLTHAYQHSLDKISNKKGDIKPSIEKIIQLYGDPLRDVILKRKVPLTPTDFSNKGIKNNFVEKTLQFQKKHLFNSLEEDLKEYLEDDEFSDLISTTPALLVSPYFYIEKKNYKTWLPLNREFVELSKEMANSTDQVFAELVIDEEIFNKIIKDTNFFEEVMRGYESADGLLFWIDKFDEHQEKLVFLKHVTQFVKKIKEKFPDKPLINLYGGYYSQLLLKFGLDGVVHGPEYGESRGVVPVGGGIPIAKFYYPEFHKRIPSNDVITWTESQKIYKPETFVKEICSCKVCRSLIKEDVRKDFIEQYGKTKPIFVGTSIREFPVQETTDNCLSHYLEVKNIEFKDIERKKLDELLKELEDTYRKFENEIWIDEEEIIHLDRWVDALRHG